MLNAILGKKLAQTRFYTAAGDQIPITEVATGPCTVVAIKTANKDGYWALKLGFDTANTHTTPKPLKGQLRQTGQGNFRPRFLREIRLEAKDTPIQEIPYHVGDTISAAQVLAVGDLVKVTGISKAKGFQGVVKRHGFKGGPRTHGQSDRERAPGSIGQTTTPGRVYKGKRMAGRMGGIRVTVTGLKVVDIDQEKNIVKLKGLVPGQVNSLIYIRKQIQ